MNRLMLWPVGVLLAVAVILASALGLMFAVLVALLAIPLIRRKDGRVGLSGLLTGFGAVWLLLIANESVSGGTLDNAAFWVAVGVVPLVAGVAILGGIFFGSRAPSRAR
jgi:large-conductance mechanosensitive channel